MNKKTFLVVALATTSLWANAQSMVYIPDSTGMPKVELDDVVVKASRDNSKLKELPASVSILSNKFIQLN